MHRAMDKLKDGDLISTEDGLKLTDAGKIEGLWKIKKNKLTKKKLTKQQEQYFKDKLKQYQYIRQNRVSLYQGIFIAFFVSIIVLLLDLIPKESYPIKIALIFTLSLLAFHYYNKMLIQTQKPIWIGLNAIGTIEKQTKVKDPKTGKEYGIFQLSDFIQRKGNLKNEKNKTR